MSSKKISELLQLETLTGKELIPVVSEGENKTITVKSLDEFTKTDNEYVTIIGDDSKPYRVYIKDGKPSVIREEAFTVEPPLTGDNARFDGLIINQMYGGGLELKETPVSHRFI